MENYSAQKRNGAADPCGSVGEPQKRAEKKNPDTAACVYAVWFCFWEVLLPTEQIFTVSRPAVPRDGGDCEETQELWG